MVHSILNTVPPEVIKTANKIVKEASDNGGTLKAQQRKYLFLICKAMLLRIPAWGLGSPCGYNAASLLVITILDWCMLK